MDLTADDRLAIADLTARATWALDTGDADAWLATFTDDAVLEVGTDHRGREAIAAFFEAYLAEDTSHPRGQHLMTAPVIAGSDDGATVMSYITRVHRLPMGGRGNTQIVWTGYAVDTCARTDGGWRFTARRWRAWEGEKEAPSIDPTLLRAG